MVQSVKYLHLMQTLGLNSILRTHVKKLGVAARVFNSSPRNEETNRDPWIASLEEPLNLRPVRDPFKKNQGRLMFTSNLHIYMCASLSAQVPSHTNTHLFNCTCIMWILSLVNACKYLYSFRTFV